MTVTGGPGTSAGILGVLALGGGLLLLLLAALGPYVREPTGRHRGPRAPLRPLRIAPVRAALRGGVTVDGFLAALWGVGICAVTLLLGVLLAVHRAG
ncbi:hypothetical protein [Streptomyces palmae]|uniref:Uncharacterized protein n=1 Tax=Streptomyces palmae TaxID=1701085 RepID=A0A4Z0GWI0_9ACTN|nr:hypothetical protein [Streptomyces palmae]TGB01362.1 hypothetical protein E4099_21105 [Streptomyces palmae]